MKGTSVEIAEYRLLCAAGTIPHQDLAKINTVTLFANVAVSTSGRITDPILINVSPFIFAFDDMLLFEIHNIFFLLLDLYPFF